MAMFKALLQRINSASDTPAAESALVIAFISGLVGFLYGALIIPIWMENVEFAQTFSGVVRYNSENPWFYQVVSRPSMLIAWPAFLLKAGVPAWPISIFFTGFQCAVACMAVSLCALIFSGSRVFALLMLVLLHGYDFGNGHYYPVFFPIYFFSFGQFGMYYALFSLALYSLKPRARLTGFLLGLSFGFHPSWALLSWVAVAADIFLDRRKIPSIRKFCIAFGLGLLVVIVSLIGIEAIKPTFPHSGALRSQSTIMEEFHRQIEIVDVRDKDGNLGSHNILVREAKNVPREILKYFYSELFFLFVALISFCIVRKWQTPQMRRFIKMTLVMMSITFIARVFEESDRHFTLFSYLSPMMPSYLHQLITNRWFNFDTLILPIVFLSFFAYLAIEKKNLISTAILGFVIFLFSSERTWSLFPFAYNQQTFRQYGTKLLVVWLIFIAAESSTRISRRIEKAGNLLQKELNAQPAFFYPAQFLIFAICFFLGVKQPARDTARTLFRERPYLGHDKFDEISAEAHKTAGTLVLVHGLKGIDDFNPQLRTGRAILLPGTSTLASPIMPFTTPWKVDLKIYCMDMLDFDMPKDQIQKIKTCLENKTLDQWREIRATYDATSVLLPDTWTLQLPLDMKSGGLVLYQIPE